MPDDGLQQLSQKDSIFLGAVGFPGVPDHISLWGLLIPIRRAFHQYINLRHLVGCHDDGALGQPGAAGMIMTAIEIVLNYPICLYRFPQPL